MIVLCIRNNVGPGNQMFMYARAYSLAKKYHHKILIVSDIRGYSQRQNILQWFCLDKNIVKGFIRLDWIKNSYMYRLFRKFIFDIFLRFPGFYQIWEPKGNSRVFQKDEKLKNRKKYIINGFWECHDYFDEYRDELIKQYIPNYILDDEVQKKVKRVKGENSVAIHIRKGDFVKLGWSINDEYYEKSLEKLKKQICIEQIYIVTEDDKLAQQWVEKKNAQRIFFNTTTKYIDEWYVMSQCKYHIISNSTYSWWSSYVSNANDKIVLIPDLQTCNNGKKLFDKEMYKNYYRESDLVCE